MQVVLRERWSARGLQSSTREHVLAKAGFSLSWSHQASVDQRPVATPSGNPRGLGSVSMESALAIETCDILSPGYDSLSTEPSQRCTCFSSSFLLLLIRHLLLEAMHLFLVANNSIWGFKRPRNPHFSLLRRSWGAASRRAGVDVLSGHFRIHP